MIGWRESAIEATRRDDWIHQTLWQLAGGPRGVDAGMLAALPAETLRRLLTMARIHGVLGLVLTRLEDLPATQPELWQLACRARRGEIVQTLRVRRHTELLLRNFSSFGIPAMAIAGIDFADQLYPEPRLRPTLAVDLLLPRERFADAVCVLCATDHIAAPGQAPPEARSGVLGARRFFFGDETKLGVTLHWNLIHLPSFRRRASVELVHLDRISADAALPMQLTAVSRMMTAAVLAAYHDQFERLIRLIDLQLACRFIEQPADVSAARMLIERTGTGAAVAAGLALAARFLDDLALERLRENIFGANTPAIAEAIFDAARQSLCTVRTPFASACRRRLRDWLMRSSIAVTED